MQKLKQLGKIKILLYSEDSFLAYPVIDRILCLLKENSILATQLKTDYNEYKAKNNIVYVD